jgi:antitoxin component of RelBE/YafQ-DinJ toxin-antitoxin module
MSNKRVTLSVDSSVYDEYKKYCEEKGIILSKQFELFMKQELKNNKRGR